MIRAFRWPPLPALPCSVPADEQLDQLFLFGRARLRKFQRVPVQFQPYRTAGLSPRRSQSLITDTTDRRPSADWPRAINSAPTAATPAHPGARRRLTGRERGHIFDIKLKQFRPQVSSQRSEPLGVRAFLGQLKAQFPTHVHSLPRRGPRQAETRPQAILVESPCLLEVTGSPAPDSSWTECEPGRVGCVSALLGTSPAPSLLPGAALGGRVQLSS